MLAVHGTKNGALHSRHLHQMLLLVWTGIYSLSPSLTNDVGRLNRVKNGGKILTESKGRAVEGNVEEDLVLSDSKTARDEMAVLKGLWNFKPLIRTDYI